MRRRRDYSFPITTGAAMRLRTPSRLGTWLGLWLALGLSACGTGAPGTDVCTPECTEGTLCVDNVCKNLCNVDNDCQRSEICYDGVCHDREGICGTVIDCIGRSATCGDHIAQVGTEDCDGTDLNDATC